MNTMLTATAVLLLLAAAVRGGEFTVQVKKTAAEQLRYADELAKTVTSLPKFSEERKVAAVRVAAALDVVSDRWKSDDSAVRGACVRKGMVLLEESLLPNVLSVCSDVRSLKNTPEEATLSRARATAFLRMNRNEEATSELKALERHPKFDTLPPTSRFSVFNDLALTHERRKEHAQSANYLRKAAAVEGVLPMSKATTLLRSVEASSKVSVADARGDLRALENALAEAWHSSPSMEEGVALKKVEENAARWRKKIGKLNRR